MLTSVFEAAANTRSVKMYVREASQSFRHGLGVGVLGVGSLRFSLSRLQPRRE
jgi:hypothetical protein